MNLLAKSVFFKALMLVCTSFAACQAAIVADSVAEFSGVQGQDNWYYGYYSGSLLPGSFAQMPIFSPVGSPNAWVVDDDPPSPQFYTQLYDIGGHPNGVASSRDDVVHFAVRRWIAELTGDLTISGNIADLDGGNGGDGIIGRIFAGSSEIYSQFIGEGDSLGSNYSFTFSVVAGTPLDFVIDPIGDNDLFDSTRFTATISVEDVNVPEPSSLLLLSTVGVFAFRRSRTA